MRLTKHFSLEEFTDTRHVNIDNSLPPLLMSNALITCVMLENIRSKLGSIRNKPVPIVLSSGYRCKELNTVVGGSSSSHHMQAMAADWSAKAFGGTYEVCKALEPFVDELGIGQLINEYGRWVHTSIKKPDIGANRILTKSKSGTYRGIIRV